MLRTSGNPLWNPETCKCFSGCLKVFHFCYAGAFQPQNSGLIVFAVTIYIRFWRKRQATKLGWADIPSTLSCKLEMQALWLESNCGNCPTWTPVGSLCLFLHYPQDHSLWPGLGLERSSVGNLEGALHKFTVIIVSNIAGLIIVWQFVLWSFVAGNVSEVSRWWGDCSRVQLQHKPRQV